ncbi:MAG: metalloprotease family protein, partial [Clostridia bacterium]|nr:metalloprotease family protein [Clostridia bacterium]
MKKNNYEAELPAGYELKYHIDAKNKKTTAIYLILSLLPVLVIFAVALLLVIFVRGWDSRESAFSGIWLVFLIICVIICVYAVCHELVHGITYKILTGGKLTFGLKWNVAFCGVPDIYVYRSAAKAAVLMPFIIFNFVFAGLTVGMYFVSDVYFLAAAAILGFHIG